MSENSHEKIEDEYVEGYLDRQLDFYIHLQQRAERLIQLLIASAAVIVTFGSSGVVDNLIRVLREFPSSTGASSFFTVSNNPELISNLTPPLTIIFVLIGVFLIIDCLLWAFGVLNMDELGPHLEPEKSERVYRFWIDYDKLDEIYENGDKDGVSMIKQEIERNKIVIDAMRRGLKSAYITLALGITFLSVAALLPISEILGNTATILVSASGLFIIPTLIFIIALLDFVKKFIQNEKEESLFGEFYRTITRLMKTSHMILIVLFGFLFFYSYIAGLSMTLVWLS